MLRKEKKQLSFYSVLYEQIPKGHLLMAVNEAIDFSFVNDLLKESYCENFGRPAKEPELMTRLLFLQHIYVLSDVRLMEEASYNLAYKWFLGLNPEDHLPDASLLAKFRTQRLREGALDNILMEIVRQCVEKGILKGKGVSVDTTHMEANCVKKVPERIMRQLARRVFKGLEEDLGAIPDGVDTDIPDIKGIDDHMEAKMAMMEYLLKVIGQAEAVGGEKTNEAAREARDILSDEKFIPQKGVRSLSDKDARVGFKSKTDNFFGYKTEFMITNEERIITAIDAHSGEYVDGGDFEALLGRTLGSGAEVDEFYGDKAYFRAKILKSVEGIGATSYIPVSASAYRIDEELFSYNKDSDQWFCRMGNHTVSKKRIVTKRKDASGEARTIDAYKFDKALCEGCARRRECVGSQKAKARTLRVSLSTPLLYEHSQRQKTPEFLEKYEARACVEWKNGEMKRFHGMSRARGFGLQSVRTQVKLTAIAVNLKRIAAIWTEKGKDHVKKARNSVYQSFFLISRRVYGLRNLKTPKFAIRILFC